MNLDGVVRQWNKVSKTQLHKGPPRYTKSLCFRNMVMFSVFSEHDMGKVCKKTYRNHQGRHATSSGGWPPFKKKKYTYS